MGWPTRPVPPVPGAEPIGLFYLDHVRPFLTGGVSAQLATRTRSAILFDSLRVMREKISIPPDHG